jgi:serine/threonine protein kinase
MGIVYRARRIVDSLIVALKVMRPEIALDPQQAQRFHFEIIASARLKHPHIVPIIDVGWQDAKPYFAMPLLTGGSLSALRDKAPDIKLVVALMEKVARGVDHAHQQGVLHRDLKPGNILLDEHGSPAVADFGLAKLHDVDLNFTRIGAIMGTWPYMSPEQADGRTHEIGPATDVWALGVILYELLAGQRPFIGVDSNEVRSAIADPAANAAFPGARGAGVDRCVLPGAQPGTPLRFGW